MEEGFSKNKFNLAIVIPTHNRREYLRSVLNQLRLQEIHEATIKKIVVVDGSTDGTLELLQDEFPEVTVIIGDGSWWYTKSMNEGFKFAISEKAEYVLALNDDVRLGDEFLKKLIEGVKLKREKFLLGAICYSATDSSILVSSGIKKIIRWKMKFIRYHPLFEKVNPDTLCGIHRSVVLPGRGLLIPCEVLTSLNCYDENFKQYHSDGDLCLRAKKIGYDSYISLDAKIFSYVGETSVSSSFVKISFRDFLKQFFNKYSRNYLPDNARFIYRHGIKILFPLTFAIFLAATFKSNLMTKKFDG